MEQVRGTSVEQDEMSYANKDCNIGHASSLRLHSSTAGMVYKSATSVLRDPLDRQRMVPAQSINFSVVFSPVRTNLLPPSCPLRAAYIVCSDVSHDTMPSQGHTVTAGLLVVQKRKEKKRKYYTFRR